MRIIERRNYKRWWLPAEYPDWYYQKSAHKDDLFQAASRHRQRRKYASSWTRPEVLSIPENQEVLRTPTRRFQAQRY